MGCPKPRGYTKAERWEEPSKLPANPREIREDSMEGIPFKSKSYKERSGQAVGLPERAAEQGKVFWVAQGKGQMSRRSRPHAELCPSPLSL